MYDYGIARRLVLNIPASFGNPKLVAKGNLINLIVDHLPVRENLYCRFEQDRMDFNPYIEYHNTPKNVLNFKDIPADCKDFVKHFALNKLDSGQCKPSTLSYTVKTIGRVLSKAKEVSNSDSFFDITTDVLISTIETHLWPTSYKSVLQAYRFMSQFFSFLELDMDICFPINVERLEWQKQSYQDLLRGLDGAERYPIVPERLLCEMQERYDEILRDENVDWEDRLLSGSLLLDTQMGNRISEIPCIEVNCLGSVTAYDGLVDHYLVYNAIKQAPLDKKVVKVKTICTDLAMRTVNYMLKLRESLPGFENNRFLLIRDTEECRKGQVVSVNWLVHRYKDFCVKYLKDIISKRWKGIRSVKVGSSRYWIPSIHSFRVTFATTLLRKGIHPDFIDCILGHNPNTNCLTPYIQSDISYEKKSEIDKELY